MDGKSTPPTDNSPDRDTDHSRRAARVGLTGAQGESNIGEGYFPSPGAEAAQRAAESRDAAEKLGPTHPEVRVASAYEQLALVVETFESHDMVTLDAIADLRRQGLSPGETLTYFAVYAHDRGQTEWADDCGISRQTVHNTLDRIDEKLDR